MVKFLFGRKQLSPLNLALALMLVSLIGCIITSGLLFTKREHTMLSISQAGSENFAWAFNQLRVEYYRLAVAIGDQHHAESTAQAAESRAELRKRYEIFVSRVNIVDTGSYRSFMERTEIFREVAPKLRAMVERTDAAVRDSEVKGGDGFDAPAISLLESLHAPLGRGIDQLTTRALEVDSMRVERMREELIAQRNGEIVNLTFQLLLLVAFAAAAFLGLYYRDQKQRDLQLVTEQLAEAHRSTEIEAEAKRAALQRALEEEQRASRLQRHFASMASHEFRTPLAIIDSSAQRMLRKIAEIKRGEIVVRLNEMRDTVARLARLVETMLEAGRVENGKIVFSPQRFNLLRHLSRIVRQQRDVAPGHRFAADLQAAPISYVGDPRLITQVMENLVSNAVRYSPEGGEIRILTRQNGDALEISIADEGVGIPEAEMPRVFETFFRASTAAGIPGTGLGLDLARKFIDLHGGQISVTSKLRQGSTFTFTLPLDLRAAEGIPEAGPEAGPETGRLREPRPNSPMPNPQIGVPA